MWFLVLLASLGSTLAGPAPSMTYNSQAYIDEAKKIQMFWNHDAESITVELHAQTTGYVAVGFSPSGGMQGADIIIGWIKDGKAILQDRYAVGERKPILDTRQDVELHMGKEESGTTVLKFKRKLDTCDPDHDLVIKSGTVKMIWALGEADPHDEAGIYYHTSRGARNIQLLGVVKKPIQLPADVLTFDLRNANYTVPSDDTTYACQVIKMPTLTKKHHLVMSEPVIKKGHEAMVHHILVYGCTTAVPINDTHEGQKFLCSGNPGDMPWFMGNCGQLVVAWAIGGEPFYYPEHTGLSMGTIDDAEFVVMETHYDNPLRLSGRVDDSGMRIHFTPTLRKYDAGILEQGRAVDQNHVIPPMYDGFKSFGTCHPTCLNEALSATENNQINVFAIGLHSHLLGTAMKTWHIRDNVELPPFAEDNYYDFNYQTVFILPKEVVVKPNDYLATECTYRSTGRRNVTRGGLSTQEEMCLTYIMYYPRTKLEDCQDRLSEWSMYPFAGIENSDSKGIITAPEKYVNMTMHDVYDHVIDWSDADIRARFQEVEMWGYRNPVCMFNTPTGPEYRHFGDLYNITAPRAYWQEPKRACEISGPSSASGIVTTTTIWLPLLTVTLIKMVA